MLICLYRGTIFYFVNIFSWLRSRPPLRPGEVAIGPRSRRSDELHSSTVIPYLVERHYASTHHYFTEHDLRNGKCLSVVVLTNIIKRRILSAINLGNYLFELCLFFSILCCFNLSVVSVITFTSDILNISCVIQNLGVPPLHFTCIVDFN